MNLFRYDPGRLLEHQEQYGMGGDKPVLNEHLVWIIFVHLKRKWGDFVASFDQITRDVGKKSSVKSDRV